MALVWGHSYELLKPLVPMLTTLHRGYHIWKKATSSLEPGERSLRSQWKLVLLECFLGHMVERPRRKWEEKPGPKRSDCVVS